jgi:hypothetical protein
LTAPVVLDHRVKPGDDENTDVGTFSFVIAGLDPVIQRIAPAPIEIDPEHYGAS